MMVAVKNRETGKFLGYICGFEIHHGSSFVLVAKQGELLMVYDHAVLKVSSVEAEIGE
jgi:hypothetical protein